MARKEWWPLWAVAGWFLTGNAITLAAGPELPVPLSLGGGNPDLYSASLDLAAEHTYRFQYSFSSIAGPRPGGRRETGQWTFDAGHSVLVLHPDDAGQKDTEVTVQLGLRITAQVSLGTRGMTAVLRSGQVTLGRLLAAQPPVPTRGFLFRLQTVDGHWVTVEAGGVPGPDDIPLRVNALKPGRFETFRLEVVDDTHCALRTSNGHYLSAANGGGVGGPNDATSPIHTDQQDGSDNAALFRLDLDRRTFRTTLEIESHNRMTAPRYVTAVNGGGVHGPENAALRTDATQRGRFETFGCMFSFDGD